ncbi:MAG: hypothetical protein KAY43_08250 [Phocaeicola sp.]|nr:hypothetical protein [Phocaeicola sp.]
MNQRIFKKYIWGLPHAYNVTNNILFGSLYEPMEGADVTTDNYKNKEHSIQDFIDKIKDLPEGTYKRLNGEIVRQ